MTDQQRSLIVNIRGTNGSGKSTLMRLLMERFGRVPINCATTNKVIGYEMPGLQARVVGKYETACGGCDTIKTQDEAKHLVHAFSTAGNVFFEGVLISTIFGPWLEFSRQHGGMIWAFLDTPLETCLERIQIRNGGKPIKTDQVRDKWEGMRRIADKAKAAGEQVIWLNHLDPLPSLVAAMAPVALPKVA